MRKDGVKADWVKHSRNSSTGKRGHNKRVRRLPLPDQEEPAFKPRAKKSRVTKPYWIEAYWDWPWLKRRGWHEFSAFAKKEDRDRELAKLLRGPLARTAMGEPRYRAVDITEEP